MFLESFEDVTYTTTLSPKYVSMYFMRIGIFSYTTTEEFSTLVYLTLLPRSYSVFQFCQLTQ